MSADYSKIKAARGPEATRFLAAHEIGHAWVVLAQGNRLEYVTLMPRGAFAGHCMRRGAKSLNFVDDRQPLSEHPAPAAMTEDIADLSSKIGAPEFGVPRIHDAEAFIRMQSSAVELVAGDVCMRIMYPDLQMRDAEHDWIEARAFASVVCVAPDAFLRFAAAEAEMLLREHLHVVTVLIDQLSERGTLTGDEVEQIIHDAIPGEMLAREHERRREMQARAKSAEKFKEMLEKA